MVAGVPPREASDRLVVFQNHFDTLYRKYVTYNGGEDLFGLPSTSHPELIQVTIAIANNTSTLLPGKLESRLLDKVRCCCEIYEKFRCVE